MKLIVGKTTLFHSWMHLRDEALAGAALQLQNGETPVLSPAAQAHLADCPRCSTRLNDLCVTVANQRQHASDIADAHFPQATLNAQRDAILTHLASRHAGARVLLFPAPVLHLPRPKHAAMRAIAATLAASLFVGLATGQVLYLRDLLSRPTSQQAQAPHIPRHHTRWTAESGPDAQPGDERDERFLDEIESALASRRRNPALRALDDMTPRAPGSEPKQQHYRER
jgi:hypothetical protein